MANNPQEQFEKKVIISLETALKGVQEALKSLRDLEVYAKRASVSTNTLSKAKSSFSKQLASAGKHVSQFNKLLSALGKSQKGLYDTMRGVGQIARYGLGAATSAASLFLVETKRVGQSMLNLQTTSLQSAEAIDRLRIAYRDLQVSTGSAVISLQDFAQTLTKFQSQGIAEMATGMNKQFQAGFAGIQSTLTRVLGKSGAVNLLEQFYQSMGAEFSTFRKTIEGEIRQLTSQFEKARVMGDTEASLRALDALKTRMNELRLYTTDQGVAAQQVVATLETLGNALQGREPTTQALIAGYELFANLTTTIENFSVKMQEVFGSDVAKIIDAIRIKMESIGISVKNVEHIVEIAHKRFVAWGGVDKVIKIINSSFDLTIDLLKSLGKAAGKFIEWFIKGGGQHVLNMIELIAKSAANAVRWFIELSDEAKVFAAIIAGITLSPSLSGLKLLITGFKDLTKWAIQASQATAAINTEAFNCKTLAAKATGIGLGTVAAVGGHFGGKTIARGLGATEFGTVDILSGAIGAAGGGAIAGGVFGPVGAAVGASIAGIGSIIVSGVEAWKKQIEEALDIKTQFDDMNKASKNMTEQLRKNVKNMEAIAVSNIQKLRLEGEKILLQRSEISDQINAQIAEGKPVDIELQIKLEQLDKDLDKIIAKRRQLGDYGTDVIEESFIKRIEEQKKLKSAILDKMAKGGIIASEAKRELETRDAIIKRLEEAGKLQTEINRLIKERQEILSYRGSVDEEKIIASLKEVQEKIDKLQSKQAIIEFGADPSKAISDVKKQFAALDQMQKQITLGIDLNIDDYNAALEKAEKSYLKLRENLQNIEGGQFQPVIEDLENLRNSIKSFTADALAEFLKSLRDLSEFSERTLPGFTESVGSIIGVLDVLGPAAREFGDILGDITVDQGIREMSEAFLAVEKSAITARKALIEIKKAEISGDIEKARRWQIQFAKAVKITDQAVKVLTQSLESTLRPLEKQADIIRTIKDIRKLDLEISRNLYGTPAISVQAQLNLVQMMQAEKQVLESQLATVQKQHAAAKALRGSSEDIFIFKMKELELAKNIKQITAEQLQLVREVRDGYLDAIKAQALGAGRFSKIIISQEQNLMRGLQKGAIKRNFLLGQYAQDAAKTQADAYRFSDQGMGMLETIGGQTMSPQDIANAVYERVANIADPLSKAAALQSAEIFTSIVAGADKNTRDLSNVFMLGTSQIVDAINNYAESRIVAGAPGLALKDSIAGITAIGSAVEGMAKRANIPPNVGFEGVIDILKDLRKETHDSGLNLNQILNRVEAQLGKPVPFDVNEYKKFAESQESAKGSIDAMIDYLYSQQKTTRTPGKQIEVTAANTFFKHALSYYEEIIKALGGQQPKVVQTIEGELRGGMGLYKRSLSTQQLARIDNEVRKHEKAHKMAAGHLARSSPRYEYQRGPDGRLYAVGGHVMIDTTPIHGDPLATINKMRLIRKAALAPEHPSQQDLHVARMATNIERDALQQLTGKIETVSSRVPLVEASTGIKGIKLEQDTPDDQYRDFINQLIEIFNKYNSLTARPTRLNFTSDLEREFSKVQKELDAYLENLITTVDKKGIEAVSQVSTQLLKPYTDKLNKDLDRLGDLALQIEQTESPDQELVNEMATIERRVQSTANLMRNIFGASGLTAVDDALSKFTQKMETKAINEIRIYQDQISRLQAVAKDASPEIKQRINNEIANLQQKIEDINIDFGFGTYDINREIEPKDLKEDNKIAIRAREYTGAIEHLRSIVAEDVDWGDMNLAQVRAITAEAERTLQYYEKQFEQLNKNKQVTEKHVAELQAARAIVAEVQKYEDIYRRIDLEKRRETPLVQDQERFTDLPKREDLIKLFTPITQVISDAFTGFKSGGLEGMVSSIQSGIKARHRETEQRRMATQGDEIMKALRSSSMLAKGGSAQLRDIPTLYTVDTDAFMKGYESNFEEEMERKYGAIGKAIAKQARKIQETERKIREAEKKAKEAKLEAPKYEFGVKDLHGYEIPDTAKINERQIQVRPINNETKIVQKQVEALRKLRDKQKAKLDKMVDRATKAQTGITTDAEFKRMEEKRRKLEKAATDKLGTTYTGKAPERVPGVKMPTDLLPPGIMGPPAPVTQISGVSDPTRIRQLTHGKIAGSWQSKGRGVREILKQAGQIIEEMGTEMDRINSDQGKITQYAGNRLFNVQPTTP